MYEAIIVETWLSVQRFVADSSISANLSGAKTTHGSSGFVVQFLGIHTLIIRPLFISLFLMAFV